MGETEQEMTKDEMQRYIDQQIRDGRSWSEALERLAEVLGLRDNSSKRD
jgi:hypothetical protein